jgi:hypothetical protein
MKQILVLAAAILFFIGAVSQFSGGYFLNVRHLRALNDIGFALICLAILIHWLGIRLNHK